MIHWIFIISLVMPSFGGAVEFRGKTLPDPDGGPKYCDRVRALIVKRMDDMRSNGIISECLSLYIDVPPIKSVFPEPLILTDEEAIELIDKVLLLANHGS